MKSTNLLQEYGSGQRSFQKAHCHQIDLRGATLCQIDLSQADLQSTNLIQVNLIGADLSGSNITQAELGQTAQSSDEFPQWLTWAGSYQ